MKIGPIQSSVVLGYKEQTPCDPRTTTFENLLLWNVLFYGQGSFTLVIRVRSYLLLCYN